MPSAPLFPLVNRVLEGKLAELLMEWQASGMSVFQITLKLRDDHDIAVSPDTVTRWIKKVRAA